MKSLIFSFVLLLMCQRTLLAQDVKLIPYRNNLGQWGYCNYVGEIIIPCQYKDAPFFHNGIANVKSVIKIGDLSKTQNMFINEKGAGIISLMRGINQIQEIGDGIIMESSFGRPRSFYSKDGYMFRSDLRFDKYSENLVAAHDNLSKWFYLDNQGKSILNLSNVPLSKCEEFIGGYAIVYFEYLPKGFSKGDNDQVTYIGVIDKKGKFISKTAYRFIEPYKNGFFRVQWLSKWSFMNTSGKILKNSFIYYEAHDFSDDRALVKEIDSKYGFIDTKGNKIIPFVFDEAMSFSCGLAAVYQENKGWGYVDKNGKQKIDFNFENAMSFSEDYAAVKIDQKWKFIDKNGVFITSNNFDEVGDFSEGLAKAKLNGKWGYINNKGEYIIQPKYSRAENFKNSLAMIEFDGEYRYINKEGHEYWEK